MKCIYCGRDEFELDRKGKPMKFSDEHILPTALVGGLEDNAHFIINDVHEYCNNVSGMFIDAPAIKNWFVGMAFADNSTRFLRIEDNPVLPLRYMGRLKDITYGTQICDMWMGPAASTIYHFHEPYPAEGLPSMVGVPPSIKKKDFDRGFAFIFVNNTNTIWHPTVIYSFVNSFKESIKYLGNGDTPKGGVFSDIPLDLALLRKTLHSMQGKYHSVDFAYTHGCEFRFLAKIALGIGRKLFGESFANSDEAALLRKFMWARDESERMQYPIHGTGFLKESEGSETMKEFFGWEGGHVLTIMPADDVIAMHLTIYNSVAATIKIDQLREEYRQIVGDGICYVIIPGLKRIIGPIKLMKFLNHKLDMGDKIQELLDVELEMEKHKDKPPYNI